jgi:hypothetical protein
MPNPSAAVPIAPLARAEKRTTRCPMITRSAERPGQHGPFGSHIGGRPRDRMFAGRAGIADGSRLLQLSGLDDLCNRRRAALGGGGYPDSRREPVAEPPFLSVPRLG